MDTNMLKAFKNIKEYGIFDLNEIYPPRSEINIANRVQNVGRALEIFVKDAFCNSFDDINKLEYFSKYFSHFGNANNPPDSIIRGGDAVEIKKLISESANIQLNSSFPKNKLHVYDPLLKNSCRTCEEWTVKDMLYVLGIFGHKIGTKINALLFVYGDCFAADEEVYLSVKNRIGDVIDNMPDSQKTNELGRINDVDPLGVTSLRVRGMWLLQNPFKIFESIFKFKTDNQEFTLLALIPLTKFNSFPEEDRDCILNDKDIVVSNVDIPDPNNPSKILECVFLRYDVL